MRSASKIFPAILAAAVISITAGCTNVVEPLTQDEANDRLDQIVGWFDYRREARADAAELAGRTDWSQARSLEVVVDNDRFEPTYVLLRANTPYSLTFRNDGARAYRFQARRFFKDAALGPDAAADAMERIELQPGDSATVAVVADRTGTYPLRGAGPDGWFLGLVGTIEVH